MMEKSNGPAGAPATRSERAVVLGGFAVAAGCTPPALLLDAGPEAVAALWLAAAACAFVSSLALALRRGLRRRDRSAFRRCTLPHDTELIDWSTQSGGWYDLALAEENERMLRGE